MTKLLCRAAFAFALVLAGPAGAQEPGADAARQQRMDQAYSDAHADKAAGGGGTVGRDLHEAGQAIDHGLRATGHAIGRGASATGHAIRRGASATGHAIHQGVRATGHAIHQGVRATGHAIHKGVDKVAGK